MLSIYENSKALKTRGLTIEQAHLVNQIEYVKKDQTWWIGKITQYIENNYPLEILVANQKEIRLLGRDSSSIKSFIIRFGNEMGSKLFDEKTANSTVTREIMIEKLGEEGANEFYRQRGASLENVLERHGTEVGKVKWNEYLIKRSNAYKEKRQNGHIYPKYNLDYYIKLHGEEHGTITYNKKINSQRYKVSKAYYIEQFGPIIGPIKCHKNKDHSSLDYFTRKHGAEKAEELYAANCLKIAKSSQHSNRYSKISKECFDKVKESVTDLHYYGSNEMVWHASGELALRQRAVCPDLFYRGKIIEFNGDLFHANPAMFDENSNPHPYNKTITAKEIWEHDKVRMEYFEDKGYKVLEIWESDYNQQQQKVIQQCIQFLMS